MTGRILVTGASGFIGRWLRTTLLDRGFAVRCFDREATGAEDEFVGDSLDESAVSQACQGVRAVCHLIGLQSSRGEPWPRFYDLNVRTTQLLLEACLRQGVEHFVFFSTEMVYGRQDQPAVAESAVLRPRGFYGKSKRMAEEMCHRFQEKGLRVTVLRPCNIMGPGKLRVVEELFGRVVSHRPIPLIGGGHRPWQVVDVRDVSELTARVIERGLEGVFNVAPPTCSTAREVYSALLTRAGSRSRLLPVPAWMLRSACATLDVVGMSPLTGDQYHRLADPWIIDPARLLTATGYTPRYGGIRSVLDTFDAWAARKPAGQDTARSAGRDAGVERSSQREVVIVTGASRGIGRATAQEFARGGSRVVLVARDAARLEQARREIESDGGEALAVAADVRDEEQVAMVVRRTLEAWGRIDVLVNNAGVAYLGPLGELGSDQLHEIVDVNLVGTLLCIRAVLPHFMARRKGHVVNISSVLGKRGVPRQAVYCASKAAVLGLSESLRGELAPHGITVTSFCPSSTETEMNRSVRGDDHPLKLFIRKRFMYTPEAVARRVVQAARARPREVVLSVPAKAVVLANRIAPGTLDWLMTRLERPR